MVPLLGQFLRMSFSTVGSLRHLEHALASASALASFVVQGEAHAGTSPGPAIILSPPWLHGIVRHPSVRGAPTPLVARNALRLVTSEDDAGDPPIRMKAEARRHDELWLWLGTDPRPSQLHAEVDSDWPESSSTDER